MRVRFTIYVAVLLLANTVLAGQNKLLKTDSIPTMAEGYSNDMQMPVGLTCLKPGNINYDGDSRAVIQLGDSQSFSDIQKDLNVDVSASSSYGMFSADASASYARHTESTQYSESFYYVEELILPTKIFSPATFGEGALNNFGKMAYDVSPEQFRYSCGDSFVQQEPLGASLFVTLKINFDSEHDKETFDANIGGGMGSIFSASGSVESTVKQYNINGNLEISAYQIGGDPAALADIFTKDKDYYYVSSCDLKDLDKCKGIIDGVINYAQNDFKNQVDYKDGKIIGNAQTLSWSLMPYSKIGINTGNSVLTPEIIAARKILGDIYKQTLKDSDFVDHILSSKVEDLIIKDIKDELLKTQEDLHANLALLTDPNIGVVGCYLQPEQCVAIKDRLVGKEDGQPGELIPINENLINKLKLGYLSEYGIMESYYYHVPIGGDQFVDFQRISMNYSGKKTILVNPINQTLTIDGYDTRGDHEWGTMKKVSEGVYKGTLYHSTGDSHQATFTIISNPI